MSNYKPGSLIFSLCTLIISILWVRESLKIDTLGMEWGGPRLFPLLISLTILTLSIVISLNEVIKFYQFIKENKENRARKLLIREWRGLIVVGVLLVLIITYALIVKIVGFLLTTIIITLYTGLIFKAKLVDAALVSLIVSLGVMLLFKIVLGVPLPEGILGW